VRLLASVILAFTLATFAGLGATWYATTRGVSFGTIALGAWAAHPKSGTQDIDPYARAAIARSGELPLGSGDGVSFMAKSSDDGRRLDGRCDVTVSGSTPLARYWTLTVHDARGQVIANPLGRYGYTSAEIGRAADGRFDIVIAPRARAGNWIPSGDANEYVLVLRLYDTPVGLSTRNQLEMPSIKIGGCA
jgi:hypothetical protein